MGRKKAKRKQSKSKTKDKKVQRITAIITATVSVLTIVTIFGDKIVSYYEESKKENYRPKIVGVQQSGISLGKANISPHRMFDSPKKDSNNIYDNLVENTIWIENMSDRSLRITEGSILKVNNIKELSEDEQPLSMVIGISENKFVMYVVNNTCNKFSNLEFDLHSSINPYAIEPAENDLSSEEMEKIFNSNNFEKSIETIHTGDIFKVFEFELSNQITNYQSKHFFKIGIKGIKNQAESIDTTFHPFQIIYKEGEGFQYYYVQQGAGFERSAYATIPKIFVDVNDKKEKSYDVNINSELLGQDTLALTQYIIPSKSCIINYSIKLMANGNLISDEKLSNLEVKVAVPIYQLDSNSSMRNEEFFEALYEESVEQSNIRDNSVRVNTEFKYDSEAWFNYQIEEDRR